MIRLIINCDDFGMSKIFNERILELLENGFAKSTTVMVQRVTDEQDSQIRRLAALRSGVSIGLHIEYDTAKPLGHQVEEQYK
jgi:predicted glycoside hydrolase/deacetylase ChbG (UPF0249 family)